MVITNELKIGGYIIKEIDIETQDKIQLLEDGVDVEEIMEDDFRILKILLYKDVDREKKNLNVIEIRRLLNAIDSYIDESIEFIKRKLKKGEKMKTNSTKLFEEMLKENASTDEKVDEASNIEKSMNDAMNKLSEAFEKKLNEATENVNKIIEKYEKENEKDEEDSEEVNIGDNRSESVQSEEK